MLKIDLPGNILIELEGHEPLFDLIYSYSSDEISLLLESTAKRLKTNKEKIAQKKLSVNYMLLTDKEYTMLNNLSIAFKAMQETPIVLLIKE